MFDTVRATLPEGVFAEMPYDYVRHLDNPAVAAIQPSHPLPANTVEINVDDDWFYWHHGNETLRIGVLWLSGALVHYGSLGRTRFTSFTLLFAAVPQCHEGSSMLTSDVGMTQWLRDFAERIAPLVPGGVTERLT